MLISFFKYLTFWTEYGGKGIIKKHRNNKQGDRKILFTRKEEKRRDKKAEYVSQTCLSSNTT